MYQEDIRSLQRELTEGERQNLRSLKRHLKKELEVNRIARATERIEATLAEPHRSQSAFNMQIDPRMKRRGARIRTREQELAKNAAAARDAILGA